MNFNITKEDDLTKLPYRNRLFSFNVPKKNVICTLLIVDDILNNLHPLYSVEKPQSHQTLATFLIWIVRGRCTWMIVIITSIVSSLTFRKSEEHHECIYIWRHKKYIYVFYLWLFSKLSYFRNSFLACWAFMNFILGNSWNRRLVDTFFLQEMFFANHWTKSRSFSAILKIWIHLQQTMLILFSFGRTILKAYHFKSARYILMKLTLKIQIIVPCFFVKFQLVRSNEWRNSYYETQWR